MSSKVLQKIPVSGTLSSNATDTASHEVIAAVSGHSIKLTTIAVTNSHTTTPTIVKLLSGTTLKARLNATANGGFIIPIPEDVPLESAVGEAWNIQAESTAIVQVFLSGYKYRKLIT